MRQSLASADKLTRKVYYASFKKQLSGIAAIIGIILPLGSFVPLSSTQYLFPPLGDVSALAKFGVLFVSFFATYVAFFAKDLEPSTIRKLFLTALAIVAVSLIAYVGLHTRFVRRIPIPTRDDSVQVSVGYERTDFANTTFGSVSDWELLRGRGTDEEQISRLWTWKSLIVARLGLLCAYSGVLVVAIGGFSLGVVYDLKQGLGP